MDNLLQENLNINISFDDISNDSLPDYEIIKYYLILPFLFGNLVIFYLFIKLNPNITVKHIDYLDII